MRTEAVVGSVLILASQALATAPLYGQCGGQGWGGDTTCVSGAVCTYSNDFYSQCLPGTAATTSKAVSTSTSKPVSTSTTKPVTSTSTSKATSSSTAPVPASTGFVKTSGQRFTLNGKVFPVVGTNAYWLAQRTNAEIDQSFADIVAAGGTVVRTWLFNDVTSASGAGTYYQLWSNGVGVVNTGADGLAKFDYVVASAKAHGVRLIAALTNNWSDYGGLEVYNSQIVGSGATHDVFYTNANVKAAFKKYVNTVVGRYVNEPTILGWELANEPRCKGTAAASSSCTPATITAWAKELSAYVKSIDSNHLVGLGDEGFYNLPGNPSYPYQGSEGIDFDANLAITTLDFGTFHAYPESWGVSSDQTVTWGTQWILDHAVSQKAANKPVIIEEYGVKTSKSTTYKTWLDAVVSSGLTGELYWQAGSHLANGDSWDDGYAIFPNTAEYTTVSAEAAAIKARG